MTFSSSVCGAGAGAKPRHASGEPHILGGLPAQGFGVWRSRTTDGLPECVLKSPKPGVLKNPKP